MVHASRMMDKAVRRQSLQSRPVALSERQDGRGIALSCEQSPPGDAWESLAVKGGGGPSWRCRREGHVVWFVSGGVGVCVTPGAVGGSQCSARHSRGVAGRTVTVLTGWVTGGPSDLGSQCREASGQISMSTRGERRVRSQIVSHCGRAVARNQWCHACGRSCDPYVARCRDLHCARGRQAMSSLAVTKGVPA